MISSLIPNLVFAFTHYPVQTLGGPRLLWAHTFLKMRVVACGEALYDAPVPGPEVIFFMLSSADTKIYHAHKC